MDIRMSHGHQFIPDVIGFVQQLTPAAEIHVIEVVQPCAFERALVDIGVGISLVSLDEIKKLF